MRLPYRNLATTPSIRDWVEDEFCSTLQTTRNDRSATEERWLHFHKMYNVELEESYMGRSRVYLAAVRNLVTTWQNALLGGIFPASDWYDVKAAHGVGLDANATAQKALQRQMLNHMKLEQQFPEALQQYLTFGNMVFRHGFEDEEEMQRFYERITLGMPLDEDTDLIYEESGPDPDVDAMSFRSQQGQRFRLVERLVKSSYGPVCRPVDMFHFFASPSTARSIQEAELVFEDVTTAITELETMHEKFMDEKHKKFGHIYENIDEIVRTDGGRLPLGVGYPDDERRLREGQEQDPNLMFGDLDEGFVNRSDCYWRGEIPGAKDPDTKKEYGIRDWLITVVNDKWCIRVHPNPRYRNRRPWHHGRMIRLVNELLGRGIVEPVASVQLMLNDIGNMTLDNLVMALNPIALIDSTMVSNFDTLQLSPGAKWFFEGPPGEAAQFVNPPNVVQLGQASLNMLIGFIQDFGGANFVTQGTPAPQGRGRAQNTASGMAMLGNAGSQGFQTALKDIEGQVMVPMLESNYELQEQFMSDKMLITMGGADGIPLIQRAVGFEDVVGEYLFTWKGAQRVREQSTIIQGLQGLMQTLVQIRQVDPEAAGAFRVKWGPFVKRLLTDGYNLPWADEVVEMPEDQQTIDPYLELDLMAEGRAVPVSPSDDDRGHLEVQLPATQNDERFASNPVATQLIMEHVKAHIAQAQAKEQAEQQRAMMQAMQALGGGEQGGPAGTPSPTGMGGGGNPLQAAAAGLSAGAQPGGM